MGASSSGLLDEAKINHIKGLVDDAFQSFSGFYRQQYPMTYRGHIHQQFQSKKGGKSLLLTQKPKNDGDEVLYQGSVKLSSWDEQGKKSKEKYVVLKGDYKVEIHDSAETLSRGSPAKLVLQPAGGVVFTSEEESRTHLEKICAGILNGAKEDSSSSAASSPDMFAVYLHLPYTGHTCFLFQQEDERDHFLSVLRACIRHRNLDPWEDLPHESQAYVRALRLYRQEKGCYESWEKLLGTEEQVLARQVMEEVLSWLQSQLQPKVKGKKSERIRQWQATVQATYTLVLEQLTVGLEALREECRQTVSASAMLIMSNLDQIVTSEDFLEQKVREYICEEAEKVCSESVMPYVPSIIEALNEHIEGGILGMQDTLRTQMNSTLSLTNGNGEDTLKALTSLRSIRLDEEYKKMENLSEKLENLKQKFGLGSVERLVHSAHLEMEQLLDNAVHTLERFSQPSSRQQSSQVPDRMERVKDRVFKQLDYDSRVVQKRLIQKSLMEITLPPLLSKMDSKYKTELQQFEQYIFSDFSSFILVHNVYDNILTDILQKEICKALNDAACKKYHDRLLDTSDLAISQYSLLGPTPPRSAPDSPAVQSRHSSEEQSADKETAPVEEDQDKTLDVAELKDDTKREPSPAGPADPSASLPSPVIVVMQQFEEHEDNEGQSAMETTEEDKSEPVSKATDTAAVESSSVDGAEAQEVDAAASGSAVQESPDPAPLVLIQTTGDAQTESTPSTESTQVMPELSTSAHTPHQTPETSSVQPPSQTESPGTEGPIKLSLGSLSEAIAPCSMEPVVQQTTDRAVYLTGQIKDNWEAERAKEEKRREASENDENETGVEEQDGGQGAGVAPTGSDPGSATVSTTQQLTEKQEVLDDDQTDGESPVEAEVEEADHAEEKQAQEEKEDVQSSELDSDPLGNVSIIRDLVTEIIEVETIISPCESNSSNNLPLTKTSD
ncbi:protein Niban 1-like [Poeciliopsis prolifica]|uniref:protein Niban 1-like n=1 Tax=Poeciliopsis prolifica TaxID=188132 RepID=UPI002413C12F|nr:protein Niban 1-like [Poeciliopsis prolifica]